MKCGKRSTFRPIIEATSRSVIPATFVAVGLGLLRFWTAAMTHQSLVILLALVMSYAAFGGLAVAFALDPDDRMIAGNAWSQLRERLRKQE